MPTWLPKLGSYETKPVLKKACETNNSLIFLIGKQISGAVES